MNAKTLLLGMVTCLVFCGCKHSNDGTANAPVTGDSTDVTLGQAGGYISVDYSKLVDRKAYTHSGRSVELCLADAEQNRNELQPFVDKFSALLPDVIDSEGKLSDKPQCNVLVKYPPGSEQPAWASIFRGGRYQVTSDYDGKARVFVEVDDTSDPKAAYIASYSVIRHCLNELVPTDGRTLNVEVYAFHNDYARSTLSLNTQPAIISAGFFGPPTGKKPLSLEGLSAFFKLNPTLQGAGLDGETVTLYGSKGTPETIDDKPLDLSDLATVYRACFHAGDNSAYISLDPNPDPTMVNVNFGGLLEDTHVGAVVLAADKRFKTFSTGLDPDALTDIRKHVRQRVAGFHTDEERMFLTDEKFGSKWVGTRYWYYPDTIQVNATQDNNLAVVSQPLFSADAERSKDDFTSTQDFEVKKAATLSPSIRANISDLNRNYAEYCSVFPELNELRTVGRLFGVCRWLKAANLDHTDIDSLLAVRLPAVHTPRSRPQLLTVSVFTGGDRSSASLDKVSAIRNLGPELNLPLKSAFPTKESFASFLRTRPDQTEEPDESISSLYNVPDVPLRAVVQNEHDLESLATFLGKARAPETNADKEIESETNKAVATPDLKEAEAKLDHVLAELSHLKSVSYLGIGGGIDLSIDHVKLTTGAQDKVLSSLAGGIHDVGTSWTKLGSEGDWVRSESSLPDNSPPQRRLSLKWQPISSEQKGTDLELKSSNSDGATYSSSSSNSGAGWIDIFESKDGRKRLRSSDHEKLSILGEDLSGDTEALTGARSTPTSYVFSRDYELEIGEEAQSNQQLGNSITAVKLPDGRYIIVPPNSKKPIVATGIASAMAKTEAAISNDHDTKEVLQLFVRGFNEGEDVAFANSLELRLRNSGTDVTVAAFRSEGAIGREVLAAKKLESLTVRGPGETSLLGGTHYADFEVEGQAIGFKGQLLKFKMKVRVFFDRLISGELLSHIRAQIESTIRGVGPEVTFAQATARLKRGLKHLPVKVDFNVHVSDEGWDIEVVENEKTKHGHFSTSSAA